MRLLLELIVWACRTLTRSRHALVLENLALRQQLASLAHCGRRPRLARVDRLFWVVLRERWADWATALPPRCIFNESQFDSSSRERKDGGAPLLLDPMRVRAAGLLALALSLSAAPASAASFTVNSVNDAVDSRPGDGICASRGGVCTLRAAIQEANALAGADSIILPRGSFLLTIAGRDEDAAATGDLDITDDLTIAGAGEQWTTIGGYGNDRVFDVHPPAAVMLSSLTITAGLPAPEEAGGGMLNAGNVTLTHVSFIGNRAGGGIDGDSPAGGGGGLENLGVATLTDVTFSRNYAGSAGPGDDAGWGGGLENEGTAILTDVTFTGNQAGAGDPTPYTAHEGGAGGGMVNDGTATLSRVTFTGNRAGAGGFNGDGGWGGGMMNGGTATLSNVSFSDNSAGDGGSNEEEDGGCGGSGGGFENCESATAMLTDVSFIQNHAGAAGRGPRDSAATGGSGGGMDNQGSATLTNVTFERNRAGDGNGDVGGSGGGLSNCSDVALTNVTIFSNQAGNGNGPDTPGGDGGGIANFGLATLTNVTIALNSAGLGEFGGVDGSGNEIASDGIAYFRNAIVSGVSQNCSDGSDIVSLGHNLDSGMTCGFVTASDRTNSDPVLDTLRDNGGFTQTMALLPGSPAIDGGDDDGCPSTDQRGVSRPQGNACDIGAYELQPATTPGPPTPTASATMAPMQTNTPVATPSDSVTPAPTPTDTRTGTPTGTPIPSMPATPTVTGTFTPTNTLTWTPTAAAPTASATGTGCIGDCNGDGSVTVDELLIMVGIAVNPSAEGSPCPAGDANGDGMITVDEILEAVNNTLNGCPTG
jgi:large repetitive protein